MLRVALLVLPLGDFHLITKKERKISITKLVKVSEVNIIGICIAVTVACI